MLQRHLALAEHHVEQGQHLLAKQRRIIDELERDGHDTTEARRTLVDFEETQKLHLADREEIINELARLT